jgi:Fic family protein
MEAALYAKILYEKSILNLNKLKYKYSNLEIAELISVLKNSAYTNLPIYDFAGDDIVFLDSIAQIELSSAKILLTPKNNLMKYGIKAMEEEISSTLTIENVDFSRDSVRKILAGHAPSDLSENRIYGIKKGLDYISNTDNLITEENIHTLYNLAIGDFLEEEDNKLLPGNLYRHDRVYVMGNEIEHSGLPHQKLNEYMGNFVSFINQNQKINDLYKATIIHFYLAYLHPYFDGNGRVARFYISGICFRKGTRQRSLFPFLAIFKRPRVNIIRHLPWLKKMQR